MVPMNVTSHFSMLARIILVALDVKEHVFSEQCKDKAGVLYPSSVKFILEGEYYDIRQ